MLRDNLLDVQCEVKRGTGFMTLDGELVAESRYEPERILREWLEAGVVRAVIVFGKVTHIDSAGLSTLLGALHRFRRHGGDLILAGLNPSLHAIFEVTSMERYFKIFDDLEAARRHLKPAPAAKAKAKPAANAKAATGLQKRKAAKAVAKRAKRKA
jgi:anti-sigma B factor antagonist